MSSAAEGGVGTRWSSRFSVGAESAPRWCPAFRLRLSGPRLKPGHQLSNPTLKRELQPGPNRRPLKARPPAGPGNKAPGFSRGSGGSAGLNCAPAGRECWPFPEALDGKKTSPAPRNARAAGLGKRKPRRLAQRLEGGQPMKNIPFPHALSLTAASPPCRQPCRRAWLSTERNVAFMWLFRASEHKEKRHRMGFHEVPFELGLVGLPGFEPRTKGL